MSALQKLEQVLVKGDLAVLNEAERIEYYKKVCESTGLNPFTKPFDYIVLNRKMVLYASKGCSDQLRKVHKVDIKVTDKSMEDGIFYVTVEATDSSGRTDTDMGAVSIGGLKGEAKANAMMKTITKAKKKHYKFKFKKNDMLLFGRESAGVPEALHKTIKNKIRIPINKKTRSLNVAMTVAIVSAEALRQNDFL